MDWNKLEQPVLTEKAREFGWHTDTIRVQILTTIDPNSSKNIIFGDLCTYLASYFYCFLCIIFVQNIVQVEYYYYVG